MQDQIQLGCQEYRGSAHLARLLLQYTGASWDQKRYNSESQDFNKIKNQIGLSFPKLPYLIHGNLKITEPLAIYRYVISISEKQDLIGKDIKDQAMVDNLEGVYLDITTPITKLFYSQNYEVEVASTLQNLKKKLGLVQKYYGQKQLAFGYITLPDLQFAQLAHYIKALSEQFYAKYPFLENVRKAVEEIPQIQAYYERKDAVKQKFMPSNCNVKPKV